MDPLLRKAFAGEVRRPQTPCPDAEMLAAFVDGGLSDDERLLVTTHAADCEHCSAVLAITAVSGEEASAASVPAPVLTSQRWRHAYWAVPLATAATLAALWVVTPRDAVAPTRTMITAANPTAPSPSPPPSPSPAPTSESPQPQNEDLNFGSPLDDAAGKADEIEALSAPAPRAEAPPASAARAAALARVAVPIELAAPAGGVRWRISGASIERSTDDAATWQREYTAPGRLTSGAAVSADVVWAAGEQGLVVRRTAGGWARVSPPAAVDIIAITAVSPAEATVTLADGGTLTTSDGGATWR